jgi:hypothetical protein
MRAMTNDEIGEQINKMSAILQGNAKSFVTDLGRKYPDICDVFSITETQGGSACEIVFRGYIKSLSFHAGREMLAMIPKPVVTKRITA